MAPVTGRGRRMIPVRSRWPTEGPAMRSSAARPTTTLRGRSVQRRRNDTPDTMPRPETERKVALTSGMFVAEPPDGGTASARSPMSRRDVEGHHGFAVAPRGDNGGMGGARSPPGRRKRVVIIDKDVAMKTRDGVTLRADVYRPDAPGRHPVLLSRLPYDKNGRRRPGDIDVFVEHGYVVIFQDTRGRFASDGDEYYPLVWEAQDGHDAVEWAAALPYSNGRVGTMGQSYLGATQYLLAPTRPPHLLASFPASAAADFHQCWVYHTGGAFELGWQVPYAILMARDSIARRGLTGTLLPELERLLVSAPTPWAPPISDEAYRRLPLMAWAELLGPVALYFADYLRRPADGPTWEINLERRHGEITVPMYHVTSWYDIFLHGGLANFTGLRERAASAEARRAQKLLVGPWAHLFPY